MTLTLSKEKQTCKLLCLLILDIFYLLLLIWSITFWYIHSIQAPLVWANILYCIARGYYNQRCYIRYFDSIFKKKRDRLTFDKDSTRDNLSNFAERVQSVIESPIFVGIEVTCFIWVGETKSDGHGGQVHSSKKVKSFTHMYDFSDAFSTVDKTPFTGSDVLQLKAPKRILFTGKIKIDVENAVNVKEWLHAWKHHLVAANRHRGESTSVTIHLHPKVPFFSKTSRQNNFIRHGWMKMENTFNLQCFFAERFISFCMMCSSCAFFSFCSGVSNCAMDYAKCISLIPDFINFAPKSPEGEALIHPPLDNFGNYIKSNEVIKTEYSWLQDANVVIDGSELNDISDDIHKRDICCL